MKKFILYILAIFWLWFSLFVNFSNAAGANIVNDARFKSMTDKLISNNVIYNPNTLKIDPTTSITDNIYQIFYPSTAIGGWVLYTYIRNIGIWILVLFLILNGMYMVWYADTEKELEKARMNFLYIWFGAFLIFAAVWLLWFLKIWANTKWISDIVTTVQNSILFQVLSFLKAAAFFVAVMLIVYHGVQIIRAYEKEDKLKAARNGIINVVASLVFIKVIDFIFYIATQEDFKTQAVALIVAASKAIWRLIWWISILYVIYAWFQLITSGWDEARYKNAISTLRAILLVWITIMLFLLITYQLFTDVFK